jgi:hypothetical protein
MTTWSWLSPSYWASGALTNVKEQVREANLLSRCADLKQKKAERDIQASMRLALARDRLVFYSSFLAFMLPVSIARNLILRRSGRPHRFPDDWLLPLQFVPTCMAPWMLAYQIDYTYLDKANRVAKEAESIRAGTEHHWFGQAWLPKSTDAEQWFNLPLALPESLRPAYVRMTSEGNLKRAERGLGPDAEWAAFPASHVPDTADDDAVLLQTQ